MGKVPTPPKHLSANAKRLWSSLMNDYCLDDAAGTALVRCACEAFDRAEGARQIISREGVVTRDRWQQLKPNPAVQVERDARQQLIASVRAMRLEPGSLGNNE